MSIPLTILGIPGSLRSRSYSRAALLAAARLLPPGVELLIFELHGLAMPCRGQPADSVESRACVADLKRRIRSADAVLFAAPEYRYGLTSVLDNAIELASQPLSDNAWAGKPAAAISASLSDHGLARAQQHLRQTLLALRMVPVVQQPVLIGAAQRAFGPGGDMVDPVLREQLRGLLADLVALVREPRRCNPSAASRTATTATTAISAASASAQTAWAAMATNEHSYKTQSGRRS